MLSPSPATVATGHGGERGSRRGNARGFRRAERAGAADPPARAADGQPRRRRAGAAGLAQGARASRLSGAGAACRDAQPALRAAVGRAQRSARRAALVPQQDPGPRRRAGPPPRRNHRRHRPARSRGLPRRCDRDRGGDPGRRRDAGCRAAAGALPALFAGDFLEGLEIDRSPLFGGWLTAQRRRFRGCHAALLEQLVRRSAGDEVFPPSREVAGARAVRPRVCTRRC